MTKHAFLSIILTLAILVCFSQQYGSFKDPRDGKVYKTVKIGDQEWMAENLNSDRFINGDIIPEAKSKLQWINAAKEGKPAWCYYNNDIKNGAKYGKLYNIFAITDKRGLAPTGFRIPYKNDFLSLINVLGGDDALMYYELKSKTGWITFGNGNNYTLFSLYPAGSRYANGDFGGEQSSASLFSFCDSSLKSEYLFNIYYRMNIELDTSCSSGTTLSSNGNCYGVSVRPIKKDNKEKNLPSLTPVFSYPLWYNKNCPMIGKEINLGSVLNQPENIDSVKHIGFFNCASNSWTFYINKKEISFKIVSNKEVNGSRECIFHFDKFKIATYTHPFSNSGREAGVLHFYHNNILLTRSEILWDL